MHGASLTRPRGPPKEPALCAYRPHRRVAGGIEGSLNDRGGQIVDINQYTVRLTLDRIAGGYPGHIDAMQAFLQNPAMARRVPAEAREEFIGQEREWGAADGSAPRSDVVKTGFRQREDGTPVIAGHQIKAMLQGAVRAIYDRSSAPSIYTMARAVTYGLDITPWDITIEGGHSGGTVRINQIIAHPRNPDIKVPSVRERQVWVGGEVEFTVTVLASGAAGKTLTESTIRSLFETGGMFVGLGTDRGYGNGRFHLTELAVGVGPEPDTTNPRRKGTGYVRQRAAKT